MAEAVPFQSPPSLEVEVLLPNVGAVRGMGLRWGPQLPRPPRDAAMSGSCADLLHELLPWPPVLSVFQLILIFSCLDLDT